MAPLTLEARVAEIEARIAIEECVARYMRGQDRLDPALHRSAFHPDAYIDCGPVAGSVDAFVDYAQGGLAGCAFTHHLIGQVTLTIAGDRAQGEVYFTAYHRMTLDGAEKDMVFGGRYIDEYRLRDGEWRIQRRKEIADWTRIDPAADQFFAMEPAYARGGRRGADFSDNPVWPD